MYGLWNIFETEFAVLMSHAITQAPGNLDELKRYLTKHFKNDPSTVVTLIGGSHGRTDGISAFTEVKEKDAGLMQGYVWVIDRLKEDANTDKITFNLLDIVHFHCEHECNLSRKEDSFKVCSFHASIQISLTGDALSRLALSKQEHVQGIYVEFGTSNGKPVWNHTKHNYSLWWGSNGGWHVGPKTEIGNSIGWLYNSTSGPPYGNGNDWFYYNGAEWVNPMGEIKVGKYILSDIYIPKYKKP